MEEQIKSKPQCEGESCGPKILENENVLLQTPQISAREKGITAERNSESSPSTVSSGDHNVPTSNDCSDLKNDMKGYVLHENDNYIVPTAKAEYSKEEDVVNFNDESIAYKTELDNKNYGNSCVSVKLLRDKSPNLKYDFSRTISILGTKNYIKRPPIPKVNEPSPMHSNEEQIAPGQDIQVEKVSTSLRELHTQAVGIHSQNLQTPVQLKPVNGSHIPADSASEHTINNDLTSSLYNNPASGVNYANVPEEFDSADTEAYDFTLTDYIPMAVVFSGITMLVSLLLKVKRSFLTNGLYIYL
ncbi:hypothetical protein PVIIG_02699 [Plasmodium vivax India VII]|uniref:Uncharacterized protein n=2 Tax=Plasmodium vivax TaxID=5855 RepID=A0A0J9TG38_PLAVI|nr:hypothetical protein PVIIG_02699 [Plasmodium vivax India VII]KMZ93717.1 hypothetical protein PVMG_05301 [Plasmodium vivax Mauritania I]